MLQEGFRLLEVDLDQQLAQIRAHVEEFKARTTHQVAEQVKETSLTVGFALVGAIAAIAVFVIVLVALHRWVDMYQGPFAALGAVGAVMALLAAVMFMLAFGRRSRQPTSAIVDRPPVASPPPSPTPSRPMPAALSAALPSLLPDASLSDVLTHRFSTRVAAASDEAFDAAAHIVRTGPRSAVFGTLAVVMPVGIVIGSRR
jgi:hypothetical protein